MVFRGVRFYYSMKVSTHKENQRSPALIHVLSYIIAHV